MSAVTFTADILIVDDAADELQMLSSLLTSQGYQVHEAVSGDQAIASAQISSPDLILLDLMMPGMNGYEVCRLIKADDRLQHIPVIFLSARTDAVDRIEAFESGGIDYITKPFEIAEVIVRVENQLRISRLQQELQQEVADRVTAQTQLESLNQVLETRIADRTAELETRHQELMNLQTQLEAALEKEQSLNLLMAQLLETISHEFSTPLSIINTATQMLKLNRSRNSLQDDDRCFYMINSNVNRISQTLKNTLTLTTAESNAIQFCPEPVNLATLCQTIVSGWKLPPQSTHQLEFVYDDQGNASASVDVTLFQQLFTNLLQNAVRFSPQGGTVQFELRAEPGEFVLTVRDRGIGIPAAEQNEVFQQFYRASNANSVPGTPGVGLGLAVVQWIVRLHQGTVAIDSELGQGTIVTVTLPRR
ncbi:hybrid sensor histidine kinase/response regulator [Leptolyngbya sp. FACHB-711]|uniref:hybrid sensor histidine kinase/response regulator n=1 Tax=unclassified Leptolyngbya TaxID=2650499 RepID=UPI00168570BE|nr:hybrid sensor histidine kinase/response regulator [Leptolyngbya sp. FACHB-711]MBD1850276.1 hybrid sensor histidine kinase/response regulator [Cyanobacteria bacterium FACHB-502]MBD2027017.1 hybrid sensor histidine kinase/response regulator [Leptolyngbya sp. FACHB-711]